MHELRLITIFGSRVRRFANDFHEWQSHECENHWKIASRVTQKSLFTVTNVLFHFLHAILRHEHTIPLKQLSFADFAIVAKDGLFWLNIVTSAQLYLWCHTNVLYWHRDVTFVDCSCTRKLTQRRSSLVNNNREYRFLTTRYSRLSVWKKVSWLLELLYLNQ